MLRYKIKDIKYEMTNCGIPITILIYIITENNLCDIVVGYLVTQILV